VVHSAVLASPKVCGKGTTWCVSCYTTHPVKIIEIVFGTRYNFLKLFSHVIYNVGLNLCSGLHKIMCVCVCIYIYIY